jgi:CDGSH-type Zn-finger protein
MRKELPNFDKSEVGDGRKINSPSGGTMAQVTIRATPNGPYLVEGNIDLYDTEGSKVSTENRPKIALCRCGASSNKPFCDGTHSRIGFQAAERVNPESAEKPK